MKISIITIAYDSVETIEDTLMSVSSQEAFHQIEYIVIDGGSTDGTLDILKRYEDKIDVLISEKDKGLYDAMNKGVERSTGEYVGILNSDDVYVDKQVVSKVIEAFKKSGADAVYGDLKYVERNNLGKTVRHWKSGEYKKNAFKKGWMPPHPAFFVKKLKYTQLGTYNLRLETSADYELMLRFIHKHKISLHYLPEVITLMRTGGQSNGSFKKRWQANREDRMAWKLNGLKPGWFTFIRKPISKLKQFLGK